MVAHRVGEVVDRGIDSPMTVEWSNIVDPTNSDVGDMVADLDAGLGMAVHPVVRREFIDPRSDSIHVFPRLERHRDAYLFGQFQLPTSADDLEPNFLEFTFVATFDRIWSVVRTPKHTTLTDRFLERLERARTLAPTVDTTGDLIGRVMTVVVSELEQFLDATGALVDSIRGEVGELADSRNLSRVLKDRMPEILGRLVDVRSEIVSIGPVVDRMDDLLGMVMNDHLDLHRVAGDGETQELFGKDTEIHLMDTWMRARRLRILQDEQLEHLQHASEQIGFLREHDELTSGRFMGAIASIMLVPTFIVGLYGMNFDQMPELHWQVGYGIVVGGILLVTAFQIWIFRRRRWI